MVPAHVCLRLFFVPIKYSNSIARIPAQRSCNGIFVWSSESKNGLARLKNITKGDANGLHPSFCSDVVGAHENADDCRTFVGILTESYAELLQQPSSVNKIDQDRTYTTVLTLSFEALQSWASQHYLLGVASDLLLNARATLSKRSLYHDVSSSVCLDNVERLV